MFEESNSSGNMDLRHGEKALGQVKLEEETHLAECKPRLKTELTQIVSLRALASSSLCTLPKQLGRPLCANLRKTGLL